MLPSGDFYVLGSFFASEVFPTWGSDGYGGSEAVDFGPGPAQLPEQSIGGFYGPAVVRPDGTLVVGDGNSVRGSLEPLGFGVPGLSSDPALGGLANASNNQVVAVSSTSDGGIGVDRLTASLTPDITFGSDSSVDAHPPALPARSYPSAVVVDAHENIVVAGGVNDVPGHLYLARFLGGSNPNVAPIATFNPDSFGLRGRRTYSFTMTYIAAQSIDVNTLGNRDVFLNGPHGYSQAATVASYGVDGNAVTVTYTIDAGAAGFPRGTQNFSVVLAKRTVRDNVGSAVRGGTLGSFRMRLR
jgi:hypothetical protein